MPSDFFFRIFFGLLILFQICLEIFQFFFRNFFQEPIRNSLILYIIHELLRRFSSFSWKFCKISLWNLLWNSFTGLFNSSSLNLLLINESQQILVFFAVYIFFWNFLLIFRPKGRNNYFEFMLVPSDLGVCPMIYDIFYQ